MRINNLTKLLLITSAVCISYPSLSLAAENDADSKTPSSDLNLEELMNTQVYSVSKRPEKISEAAASVYVLTAEDIKRSGATSIPEALRLVPGVDVAQTNANTWAVSIRGFNSQYSNKLLVLIDGRSVYTPLFSGVYWDSQDYVLEDIERIEVIKGPGGTLWGANAVNGVINIITKEARKTQGNYASETLGVAGSGPSTTTEYRYGGKVNDDDFYRVYGKFNHDAEMPNSATEADNNDDWHKGQTGFRYDFRDKNYNQVTLEGDYFNGKKNYPFSLPTGSPPYAQNVLSYENFSGANTMLKWNLPTEGYNTDLKAYLDYSHRDAPLVISQDIVTSDIDVQTQHTWGRNSFIGGGEIRYITDELMNTQYIAYRSNETSVAILSTFLQDKITLVPEKLFLTLGSKFDYNDYTKFEVEPNARLSYQINESNSVWAAVSRAVRTPTRGEDGFSNFAPPGVPLGLVSIIGNEAYESEDLVAYELGYRGDLSRKTFFDISAFYNNYTNLKTGEAQSVSPPITVLTSNNGYGETYGVETYVVWGVTDKWDLKPSYTFLLQNFHVDVGSNDTTLEHDEERSPENQFSIGSYVKVMKDVNWDTNLYYVSNLHYYTDTNPAVRTRIDAYARLDTQVRWQVAKDLEVSLIGQNLLDDKHQEFNEVIYSTPSEIPRAVLARLTAKF